MRPLRDAGPQAWAPGEPTLEDVFIDLMSRAQDNFPTRIAQDVNMSVDLRNANRTSRKGTTARIAAERGPDGRLATTVLGASPRMTR